MPVDLGDLPEPTVEPPERFPGGADSIADEEKYGSIPDQPLIPDLPNDRNPATDDEVPDEISQSEQEEDAEDEQAADESGGKSDALGEDTPV
ncbi:hypothetical protein [Nocardioides bigeumensis]|uniref:Uncharacterized protein n=1 Tax=Nocardioides bigeumensis TaxID=433657 RepID=A0ABN2YP23_9ACTN